MYQVDHNINKDMSEFDLIDVESLDFSDEQTWLCKVPGDSGEKVDIVDWDLSLEWPTYEDEEYKITERELYATLDEILNSGTEKATSDDDYNYFVSSGLDQVLAMPDKHKFDSRTYVRPKKATHRPSIHTLVEATPSSLTTALNTNKYLTYNKYNSPLGPILRLKTFSVDANTENSNAVKEYAMKRRSLVQDDTDPQLEDVDMTLTSDTSERLSSDHIPTKPINIDLSQPANNIHSTFNKGVMMNDRGSLNMYQSGESLMRMSPPSLVSSLLMESSGNFNPESLEGRKSISNRDSGIPTSGRESIDQMMTSMTLSILDEKDMSTSFLSQTTYPDNDSFMDSLPPSLVSSVNSSYIVSNTTPRARTDSVESSNVFSSATFTHLEQSEKLLSARPRHQMYNSFKRDTPMRNSTSYTKSREEACQIENGKILNENIDKKDSTKVNTSGCDTTEPVMLHYSNNKFRNNNNDEKENLNASFEKDEAFYKDMGMHRTVDLCRNSMNVTLDKQELNEIIQARQKLSLARKALPTEPDRSLPNQVETSPNKYVPQNQPTPKKSMENASELLSRRRAFANGYEKCETPREPPKRNATFKKASPGGNSMDSTVVYVKDKKNIIDINSATLNLIDTSDKTLQNEEWGSQERAMVGSSESTDTATFSSSSPPESVPDTGPANDPRAQVASTPLIRKKDGGRTDLLNLHNTISPIFGMAAIDDKSYTVTKAPSSSVEALNMTINTGTIVKRAAKRDILSGKTSPEKRMMVPQAKSPVKLPSSASYNVMAPPNALPKKTGLPTSKLRQYSSHRELRLPNSNVNGPNSFGYGGRAPPGRSMVRRNVYASNPALSPTASVMPHIPPPLHRTDSYTITIDTQKENEVSKPVLTNPPALVRQGTETLRRERPLSQMVQPKDLRAAPPTGVPVSLRNQLKPTTTTRPYSIAGASNLRVARPTSVPHRSSTVPPPQEPRPLSTTSALPRPSRLPAPRRTLRPPSVYSVAPAAEADHY